MPDINPDEAQAVVDTNRVIWGVAALMLVGVCIGFRVANLSFDPLSGTREYLVVGACVAIAFYYRRWRPDPWISIGAETSAQLAIILTLGLLLSYPLAAAAFPYRDAELHALDVWLGFNWQSYLRFMNEHPTVGYDSVSLHEATISVGDRCAGCDITLQETSAIYPRNGVRTSNRLADFYVRAGSRVLCLLAHSTE
jgi:hypothetical protein